MFDVVLPWSFECYEHIAERKDTGLPRARNMVGLFAPERGRTSSSLFCRIGSDLASYEGIPGSIHAPPKQKNVSYYFPNEGKGGKEGAHERDDVVRYNTVEHAASPSRSLALPEKV